MTVPVFRDPSCVSTVLQGGRIYDSENGTTCHQVPPTTTLRCAACILCGRKNSNLREINILVSSVKISSIFIHLWELVCALKLCPSFCDLDIPRPAWLPLAELARFFRSGAVSAEDGGGEGQVQ